MSNFVKLLSAFRDLGPHRQRFCSKLQVNSWYELLVGEVEQVVTHEHGQESENPATQATTVYEQEAKVEHYVWVPGI